MNKPFARALHLGLIFFGLGAAAKAADFPPLTEATASKEYFSGKFVWADLFTPDPDAAQAFYTGLFGWEATTIEHTTAAGTHDYIILKNGGDPVAGIAHRPSRMPGEIRGRWVGYVSVPDVAKALAAATASGGRVLFAAKDLPQRGTQAILIDPEGAELGLLHSSSGDPGEFAPEAGDWTWAQLFARDPIAESRFYAGVAGWESLPDLRDERPNVFVLTSGDYSRASVAPLSPRPKAKPGWLMLVRVPDVKAAVAKATSLGGKVIVAPSEAPTEYWRAVVVDPTGAAIGLVQLEEPTQPKAQP
jgi:uncharacterized protein